MLQRFCILLSNRFRNVLILAPILGFADYYKTVLKPSIFLKKVLEKPFGFTDLYKTSLKPTVNLQTSNLQTLNLKTIINFL